MTYIPTVITSDHAPTLTTRLMTNFNAIAAELGTGGGGALTTALYGSGRIVGIDTSLLAPTTTATPALAVKLPSGMKLILADGSLHVLASDVTLTGIAPNVTRWLTLQAEFDEESEEWLYTPTWNVTRPVLGAGTVAKVTTDADSVTEVLADYDTADLIPSMPALLNLIGSGGGGGGSISYAAQLLHTEADARPHLTVLTELLAQLEARLLLAIAQGGRRPMQTHEDQLMHAAALIRQITIALSPDTGERHQSANILATVDGIYGDGSGSYPDHLGPTTLVLNTDGELEP